MYVIWLKPDGTIYHKFVSGHYSDYFVGFVNSYGHEVIYIINDIYYGVCKPPLKLRYKRRLIRFIEKL